MSAFAIPDPPSCSSTSSQGGEEPPLPDPDDDDDLDYLSLGDSDFEQEHDDTDCGSKTKKEQFETSYTQYILGTLVVRVVAARDLQITLSGGLGQLLFGNGPKKQNAKSTTQKQPSQSPNRQTTIVLQGPTNIHAKLQFGNQTQRTTNVCNKINPIPWPRGEQSFFDVSLPIPDLVQEEDDDTTKKKTTKKENRWNDPYESTAAAVVPPPSRPILNVSIYHTNKNNKSQTAKYPTKSRDTNDEVFLGSGSIDLNAVITGKYPSYDTWVPLHYENAPAGDVRILCEYEPTDPPPRPGDMCRLTGFCNPDDLYPIPPSHTFLVDNVNGDDIVLSYVSPEEGWLCTFQVHRFMILCAVRHQAALEKYYERIADVADRIVHSAVVDTVSDAVNRLPEDGLLDVGKEVVSGGAVLLSRWFRGGIGMALGDIVQATNLDGNNRVRYRTNGSVEDENERDSSTTSTTTNRTEGRLKSVLEFEEDMKKEALPGMPCCPITGQPMRNPVVAADGHTYEKSAITRWFETSDKSPMTGAILPHRELAPNYLLLSSFESSGSDM